MQADGPMKVRDLGNGTPRQDSLKSLFASNASFDDENEEDSHQIVQNRPSWATAPPPPPPPPQQQPSSKPSDAAAAALPKPTFVTPTPETSETDSKPDNKPRNCEACSEVHIATHMCVECNEYYCETVASCHCKTKFTRDHNIKVMNVIVNKPSLRNSMQASRRNSVLKFGSEKNKTGQNSNRKCSIHLVKVIDHCCLTCTGALICQYCAMEEHQGHKLCKLGEMSDKNRRDIARVYESLEEPIATSREGIQELAQRMNTLEQDKANCDKRIEADFDAIVHHLMIRKKQFKENFANSFQASYNILQKEQTNLQMNLENAFGFQSMAEQLLDTGSDLEICETSKNLCKAITDLVKIFDEGRNLTSCSVAKTQYVNDVLQAIASVENPYKVIPVTAQSAVAPSVSMIGNPLLRSTNSPLNSSTMSKSTGSVSPLRNSGSPTAAQKKSTGVVRIKDVQDDAGSAVGKLCHPNGLCLQGPYSDGQSNIFTDSQMYVSDESLSKIQVFNVTTGLRVRTLGSNLGPTFFPHGMCVQMSDGKLIKHPILFVADVKNNMVYALDSITGNKKFSIGKGVAGSQNDQFNQPSGVGLLLPSVSSESSTLTDPLLYVADSLNHRVQVFSAVDGKYFCTIGAGVVGSGIGQLNFPMGLCLQMPEAISGGLGFTDPLLYVADKNNNRIQVFNALTGAFVRMIASGVCGAGPDQLNSPRRVDIVKVNDEYHLFVADYHNHRIQVFNATTGAHIRVLGPAPTPGCHNIDVSSRVKGDGVGQLNCPSDLVAFKDIHGNVAVYVAERNNHRIQVLT